MRANIEQMHLQAIVLNTENLLIYRKPLFKHRKPPYIYRKPHIYRWSKTIVGQVDLKAKLYLSFCLELQSAKSTYQPVDLDLH